MTKQIDIRRATFRVVHESPSHLTYGIWINGAKSGELVVRQEEKLALANRLRIAGFLEITPNDPNSQPSSS